MKTKPFFYIDATSRRPRLRIFNFSISPNILEIIGILLVPVSSVLIFFTGITNAAGVGADFLKIIPDARASAMGGAALASSSEGAGSLYWNPAINAKSRRNEILTSYVKQGDVVEYGYVGFALGHIGINITFLQQDEFVVDSEGNKTDESFVPRDFAAGASYSFPMNENLSIGVSAKYIRQEREEAANTFAGDITALYKMPTIAGLKLSASIQNMGSKISFGGELDNLPLTFRAGAAYQPTSLPGVTAAMDLIKPINGPMSIPYGIEVYPIELYSWLTMSEDEYMIPGGLSEDVFAIRIGHDGSLMNVFDGLSAGFGIKLSRLKLNYAFKPYSDIEDAHRVSLSIVF